MKFEEAHIHNLMTQQDNIRIVTLIGQVDHGKATLLDSLLQKSGIIVEDQNKRGVQNARHARRIQSCLYHESNLINIIHPPQELNEEAAAVLIVSDGAILVIDVIEGVGAQTQSLLRLALKEKVKPILMINKMDRLLLELQLDEETIYSCLEKIIEELNVIIRTFEFQDVGPELGNVAFGSARQNWAFSCLTFAKLYGKKFGIDPKKLQAKFWGNNYFDIEQKKWLNHNQKQLKNSFIQFILSPIMKFAKTIMDGNIELIQKMITKLNISINVDGLEGKHLFKSIMSTWINAPDALLEMIVVHLPSPKQAQKYRIDTLQQGPQNDIIAEQMRDCNPNGPLIIYITKMIPNDKYYAFGRIFSGTIAVGQKVRILGSEQDNTQFECEIQQPIVFFDRSKQYFSQIPCGNLVGLIGIDQYLTKCGTITDHPDCQIIRSVKVSTTPVVKILIQPKVPTTLPKLMEGVNNLAKCHQSVQYTFEQTGEIIVACSGENQLQICLEELEYDYARVPFLRSDPYVEYKETITSESHICMTKSPNKCSRIYAQAMPLDDPFPNLIEKGQTSIFDDKLNLWAFGPNNIGPNILIDQTNQDMSEVKDSMVAAWQWTTKEGPLCEENQRGIRVNILDGVFHPDAIHRGGGQIVPAARRLYYACELTAQPRLLEPIYETEITTINDVIENVYSCLNMRRGIVFDEQPIPGSQLSKIRANIRVSDSFGFDAQLRAMSLGQAFQQSSFDHWAQVDGDPMNIGSKANEIVLQIRKRKGLKAELPNLDNYIDKL